MTIDVAQQDLTSPGTSEVEYFRRFVDPTDAREVTGFGLTDCASSSAVGRPQGSRVKCAPGIGPTGGRRSGPAAPSARRQPTGRIPAPKAANRAQSSTEGAPLSRAANDAANMMTRPSPTRRTITSLDSRRDRPTSQ